MVEAAFLVVPLKPFEPGEGWALLSTSEKMAQMRKNFAGLTSAISARLDDMHVDYMELGSWTVRIDKPAQLEDIARKLDGLPVRVAPHAEFGTL